MKKDKDYKKILSKIKSSEEAKKSRGEVFTPLSLVEEMLDKLPEEVWYNPYLKWLEPSNGIGNFPVCIFLRLMKTLKDYYDMYIDLRIEENRRKWILEEMLYVSELDESNCIFYNNLLSHNNTYKLNINQGDSLELDTFKKWKIKKFDIIVGNPPYNANGTINTGNIVWNLFVHKSLNKFLIDNGYLCFVHPSAWRKPVTEKSKTNGYYELMTKENTMLYLAMRDIQAGMKTFHAGTRFDYYVIRKTPNNNNYKTIINDCEFKTSILDISNYKILPNYNIEYIMNNLFDFDEKNNINEEKIIYNRTNYGSDKKYVVKIKNNEFKYSLIHAVNKSGIRYLYSSRNDLGHFRLKKVIISKSGITEPLIDNNGEYGLTELAMGIPFKTDEEAEQIKNTLMSTKFKHIMKSMMFSQFGIEWRIFLYFKKDWWKLIDTN